MVDVLTLCRELAPLVKDIVLLSAAVSANIVAWKGLGTWRKQISGKKEYELALRMLTQVYRIRKAVENIRQHATFVPKEPDLPKEDLEAMSDKEKSWHCWIQAYQELLNPITETDAELETSLFEAEAIWGAMIREKVDSYRKVLGTLRYTIGKFIRSKDPSRRKTLEFTDEDSTILFGPHKDEPDPYGDDLEKSIREIEKILGPHILRFHGKK